MNFPRLPRITTPGKLRRLGVLGMNERNRGYVQAGNPPRLVREVDDKLATKELCRLYGIATPRLAGVISRHHELRDLEKTLNDLPDFVIKPSRGSGGRGILVVTEAADGRYRKASAKVVGLSAVRQHVGNVLAGLYSLGGAADVAVIERCIRFSEALDRYSFQGVPDARVVVYRGYPVMAMLRCSTKRSDGKANLHQGAVGVGLDIASGRAIAAVRDGRPVDRHPDTEAAFRELVVPDWDRHLELATTAFEMTGLTYFGADIVLDRDAGPLILELNARPGLTIQTANLSGQADRLAAIAALGPKIAPPRERIAAAKKLFGVEPPGNGSASG